MKKWLKNIFSLYLKMLSFFRCFNGACVLIEERRHFHVVLSMVIDQQVSIGISETQTTELIIQVMITDCHPFNYKYFLKYSLIA